MNSREKAEYLLALRRDIAREQKKGLHFILAAVLIWAHTPSERILSPAKKTRST